jgi:Sperm-tail PG-rich repeat
VQNLNVPVTRPLSTLNKEQLQSPGPGNYNPAPSVVKAKTATINFGSEKRPNHLVSKFNEAPGPGNYNQGSSIKGDKGFSLGAKQPHKYNENPGPGAYDSRDVATKPTSAQSIRFNNSKRGDIVRKEDLEKPGPGNYNQGSTLKADKGFSLGAKTKAKFNENPGPGAYDARNDLTKAAAGYMRVTTAKRKTFMEETASEQPGPGNYDQGSAFKGDKGFSIGAKQPQRYNENPGPGAYDARNDLTKAAPGSMRVPTAKRKTFMEEAPTDLPGPGNYD